MTTPLPPQSNNVGPGSQLGSATASVVSNNKKFITTDPAAFTKKLQEINNDFEVLIVLKDATVPGLAKQTIKELPTGTDDVIAIPATRINSQGRSSPGFASVNSQSRQSVKGILSSKNVEKLRAPDYGSVITATLPEKGTKGIIAALLNSPNVDYIEANKSYPVKFNDNLHSLSYT